MNHDQSNAIKPDQTTWRLILDPPARGSWNMAVDEALLESATHIDSGITLRIFTWEPACLSLGHAQPVKEVDLERLRQRGWDLVRRPTGGRAILHTDEITYSISGNFENPLFKGGILPSYQRISLALLSFLESYGLDPSSKEAIEIGVNHSQAVCFEVPSNYEITISDKKIIGSAQARRRNGVLQHGSVPLFGDIARITEALAYLTQDKRHIAADRVHAHATTLENATGQKIHYDEAVKLFIQAFESIHHIRMIKTKLTDVEKAQARRLEIEKYADPDWTNRI